MRIIFKLIITCLLVQVNAKTNAQELNPAVYGEYVAATFEGSKGDLPYRIMFPKSFDRNKEYPVVLFLHGAGERGDNNESQLVHGSKLFQDSSEKYPAIVIFPQCPREDFWATVNQVSDNGSRRFSFPAEGPPTEPLDMVMELLDKFIDAPYTDDGRVYVTGLSMGGMGTWELLWRIPNKIAAAAPICGGGNPDAAPRMVDVPIWAFHGMKDDVVRPNFSIRMVKAVQRAGGVAKITLFPNANHNSWDPTFEDPDYLSWLFSKQKN